jgi:diadenosine tetraphosphate (Ap4A) HIT family hydrolase
MFTCTETCTKLPASRADWIGELRVGRLFLNTDQRYPGYCILVARRHVVEITELDPGESEAWWRDIQHAARAVQAAVAPGKLNIAMLGNLVPHLHCHVIPRHAGDDTWPGAIWSQSLPAVEISAQEKAALIERIRLHL